MAVVDLSSKAIVVLGGSYAGISTAHYLLKHVACEIPTGQSLRVVLISTSAEVLCRPACPRAMISDESFDQSRLFVDVVKQFEHYPSNLFSFVHGTVLQLDHSQQTITVRLEGSTEKSTMSYHALVIATGSSTKSPLLGLTSDGKALRQNWRRFREALPTARQIVIAGGGPAGVETAGEIGEHLNGRQGWFRSTTPKVDITLVNSGATLLPALRPAIGQKAESYLRQVGVTILSHNKVASIERASGGEDPAAASVVVLEDGTKLRADIYIPATGTTPNTAFVDSSLLTEDQRIETNPATLRVDKAGQRVYAVGDVSSAARPAIHIILEQIPVVCANIKRDLLLAAREDDKSAGSDRIFKEDTRETQMVLIGKSAGVGAAMGWPLPSWLVKMIKRDYWLWTTGDLWSGKQWNKEK